MVCSSLKKEKLDASMKKSRPQVKAN